MPRSIQISTQINFQSKSGRSEDPAKVSTQKKDCFNAVFLYVLVVPVFLGGIGITLGLQFYYAEQNTLALKIFITLSVLWSIKSLISTYNVRNERRLFSSIIQVFLQIASLVITFVFLLAAVVS